MNSIESKSDRNIENLILELNYSCNNNCVYCYVPENNRRERKEKPTEFFVDILKKYAGVRNVDFTGGEPTLYSHLFELISLSKSLGYEKRTLVTNGRMLAYKDYCKKLVASGLNRVVIPLDGPDMKTAEAITRTPGSFEDTINAIKNVKGLGIELGVTVVVNKLNYKKISDTLSTAIELGADFINIQFLLPYVKDKNVPCKQLSSAVIPSYEDAARYVKMALDKYGDQRKINVHFIPFCFMKGYENYLKNESIEKKFGRLVASHSGCSYNVGEHLQKGSVKPKYCDGCKYSDRCVGLFPTYAKEFGIENLSSGKKSSVLLFRNILNSGDKEDCSWFSPGAHYLASSLNQAGVPFELSDSKISLDKNNFITKQDELGRILEDNPEINIIAITLCEDYFDKVKQLIKFIRKKSNAFIALGGPMPTLSPEHVLAHLPGVNIVIRGDGEDVLPEIAGILAGMDVQSEISDKCAKKLRGVKGLYFSNDDMQIISSDSSINETDDYDNRVLDFSILEKKDVENGLNLFTSRGCENNCTFCTTVGKGKFRAKSFSSMKEILENYHHRLKEIYGGDVPESAFKLSFNDDDFLGDHDRAISFFNYIIDSPFYINFIQTGINSFFVRKGKMVTDELDTQLLDSISEKIFMPKSGRRKDETFMYIGTENFSDNELKRLGKGYNYEKVERVVEKLSERGIKQTHHLILTNAHTALDDIMTNIIRSAQLRIKYGDRFNVLHPLVTHLVSLYPSSSYSMLVNGGLKHQIAIRENLQLKSKPQFDYPLVDKDIPADENVAALADRFDEIKKGKNDYFGLIDNVLFFLLFRAENLSLKKDKKSKELAKQLYKIIDKYKDYPSQVMKGKSIIGSPFENNKANVQLMVTRKCQLRCKYCPVMKSNETMDNDTLHKAAKFLVGSSQNSIRMDFTGGEPMLAFDKVKAATDSSKDMARKSGKEISFYMVSNILALDNDVSAYIRKNSFNIELSIDGNEDTQNINKIPVDKNINPYEIFKKKLDLLGDINKVAVVVVTPKTVRNLYDNFKHIIGLGLKKIELNYALGVYWNQDSIKQLFEQFDRILADYNDEIMDRNIQIGNLSKRLEPAILNSELMVDTDGSIHFLSEWVLNIKKGKHLKAGLGNVHDNPDMRGIFSSRFRDYYMIHQIYTKNSDHLKKVVINNILLGIKTSKYFREVFGNAKQNRI